MQTNHITKISRELSLKESQVTAVVKLLEEGGTVPFIARYRKEATGTLDEVAVTAVRNRLAQLSELEKRCGAVIKSLEDQGILSEDLKQKVFQAETMTELEDIYLPYRPKRRTKASIAREKGLEPLATCIFQQENPCNPEKEAADYIAPEKGVKSLEDALAGARDIIAETINEDLSARQKMRDLFFKRSILKSKVLTGKEEEGSKYRDYFAWEEPAIKAPSHRLLAMRRGEKEQMLTLSFRPNEEDALNLLEKLFLKGDNAASEQVKTAIVDCYKRLLCSSIETEFRLECKQQAEREAIRVFADNLRELLLSSPLGEKSVLAIDPGFRTGCKVVCLDKQGKLLHNDLINPHQSEAQRTSSAEKVISLCKKHHIEAIAIGNGTAGRETETFIRTLSLSPEIQVVMVNESGASIYSASEVARAEFPEYDLTVRGSVSIGRRMQDPLAELVKIDAKSIGVGQYQHDVDQKALKQGLDDVVISCVNAVGVEVNSASEQLLTYVSGLSPQIAKNIVAFRNENGAFKERKVLKKVPRLGEKAYEQAAGFFRIRDGKNPLDASAVHPESYCVVESMASDLGTTVEELIGNAELCKKIDIHRYVTESVGLPTLRDILSELAKPGRDPRKGFESFSFADGIEKMEDLVEGMKLPGIVTNVTAFGAFVDIGVHQDGLVHVSQLADRFVKNPADIVKVQQKVTVTVTGIDIPRKRIALSMKNDPGSTSPAPRKTEKVPVKKEKEYNSSNPFVKAFQR